ncbi:hypothetical protein [Shinella sumterensis]|uniref:Uncharacterized protein n=1 Tax=Shinella sumterensis TaxID=1967501 RepID=A0AA50HGP5_9HYPH|nr:hypothetical protein [Shinella sumterensis]MDP9590828.1 hypothetical protein [Shinella zoogloeoides]WLR98943.1 hypothetical protein Q9313_07965 [Shinella sumterensis]WLS08828.1 hypothetical protein Q9314_03390 [Shinella sumterensis]
MNTVALSTAALALLVAGSASAASLSGIVQDYDARTGVIRLQDGNAIALPVSVPVPANLKSGSAVNILLNADNNQPRAVLAR